MNTFREIREQLGQTQSELAKSLGQSQGNISNYEHGQMVPPDVAGRLIEHAKAHGHRIDFNEVYKEIIPPQRKANKKKPH